MIATNNYNPDHKKDIPCTCKYGCGTSIRFDPNILSDISQKLIPLELDNNPHKCPNRSYKAKDSVRKCYYCNQDITFHDDRKAPSGRKIPLNLDESVHDCESNPYRLSRKERS